MSAWRDACQIIIFKKDLQIYLEFKKNVQETIRAYNAFVITHQKKKKKNQQQAKVQVIKTNATDAVLTGKLLEYTVIAINQSIVLYIPKRIEVLNVIA